MNTVSGQRLLRQLRGLPLATVAKSVGCQRAHLSSVERDPSDCGPTLKKRLEEFYHAPWTLLSKEIDASKIAGAITAQHNEKKVS